MWLRSSTCTVALAAVLAVVAFHQVLLVSCGRSLVAQNEDDLIRAFKDPEVQIITLNSNMVMNPDKWPGRVPCSFQHSRLCASADVVLLPNTAITVIRNLTVRGENMTEAGAAPGTARPLLLDFNFLYMKWTIAPGFSLTFEDFELVCL
jgi:hypothetical protein